MFLLKQAGRFALCDGAIEVTLPFAFFFNYALDRPLVVDDSLERADGGTGWEREDIVDIAVDRRCRVVVLYDLCDAIDIDDVVVALRLDERILFTQFEVPTDGDDSNDMVRHLSDEGESS